MLGLTLGHVSKKALMVMVESELTKKEGVTDSLKPSDVFMRQ